MQFGFLSPYPIATGVLPTQIKTTLPNGRVSIVSKNYDSGATFYDANYPNGSVYPFTYGSLLQETETDYGQGAPGPVLRQTFNNFMWQGNSDYKNANLLELAKSTIVEDGSGNQVSRTDYGYDDPARLTTPNPAITTHHGAAPFNVRGHLTSQTLWLNTGPSLVSYTNWFDTGEIYQSIDPRVYATTFSYDPAFAGAYVTQTQAPDTVSGVTTHHITQAWYDFNTGLKVSATDQNNQTTTYSYDNMWRVTSVTGPPDPNNGSQQAQTTYGYNDTPHTPGSNTPYTYQQDKIDANNQTTSWTQYDGLGRAIRAAKYNGETNPSIIVDDVDTCYDGQGQKIYQTYPYQMQGWQPGTYHCPSDPATPAGESFSYDALGRLTTVKHADGNIVSTNYSQFPVVTVTDEAGHARQSQSDALGRLIKVWEPDPATGAGFPNETDYAYDTLNNLLQVLQQGGVSDSTQWRGRYFRYDSLSRLLIANNPESGAICYGQWQNGQCVNGYDANGNLITKTSPLSNQTSGASLQTTFYYDELNRLTAKCFSDGTPCESLYYDSPSLWGLTMHNPIGRLVATGVSSNNANTLTSYDVMGRPEWQVELRLGAPLKTFNYAYNLDGSLKTVTYPSGRVVNYGYNIGQRPVSAVDSTNNINFATGAHYTAAGALSSVVNGNTALPPPIATTFECSPTN